MTLGNDPQPLTRRQARELARSQAPSTADDQTDVQKQNPDVAVDRPAQSRRAGTTDTTPAGEAPTLNTTFTELSQPAGATDAAPAARRVPSRREMRTKASKDTASNEVASQSPLHPPVGHWSVDRDEDDAYAEASAQNPPLDELMSRGIAAGGIPTTTNALILPSIPQQGPLGGQVNGTGEILITGSIDLPRSFGATGEHPNYFDSTDMDIMLDQLDQREVDGPSTNVTPVSASRAVSSHSSTRGVMTPPKKRAMTLPAVLAATAAVLAVGVLALFVAGYFLGVF